jgi:hypothetical protein
VSEINKILEDNMTPHLSAPWYTLWNEIKATIGNDSDVSVGDLDTSRSPFIVPIKVNNHDKAVAIASIMALHHQLGNVSVDVQVKDPNGTIVQPVTPSSAQALTELVQVALAKNNLFEKVVVKPLYPGARDIVYPVFSKAVIQFYNDDLSDLYNNYNNVAASVFSDVLNPAPGGVSVYSSTTED